MRPGGWAIVAAAAAIFTAAAAFGQAEPTGIGPGTYIQLGVSGSLSQEPYGQRKLGGGTVFVDAHLYRRIGAEAEVSSLQIHQDEGVHATTYLVGPRYSMARSGFRPYSKLLVGKGEFHFPFNYATGWYFVVEAGGGVDWHIPRTPITVRLIDVELQDWPGFSFGALHPYGIQSGIALRVF